MINNNNDDNRGGVLFLKVFRNKVIWNIIKEELYLYSINKRVRFYKKQDLLDYSEKEYITELELHFSELPNAHEIPSSVRTLFLDNFDYKNHSLYKSNIPLTISHLKIGSTFKKELTKDIIPDNIEFLEFTNEYSSPIQDYSIPQSVTSLKYGKYFNFPNSNNAIPKTVKKLILCDKADGEIVTQSTFFLRNIMLNNNTIVVPNKIEELIFGRDFNTVIKPFTLPSTLRSIKFGKSYNQALDNYSLPVGLKSIVFGEDFNIQITNSCLPPSLTSIQFKNQNYDINGIRLPQNVKILKIGNKTINNDTLNQIIQSSNSNNNNYNNNNNNNNNSIYKNFINKIFN